MTTKSKRIRNLASLGLVAGLLAGCGSTGSDDDAYTESLFTKTMNGKAQAMKRDLTNFYRTFDRHIFNYDWDDPYLD